MSKEKDGFTQEQWEELCEYVKDKVFGYDDTKKLPRFVYLRLRGLSKGQFIANNKFKVNAEYDYNLILLTFKFSLIDIKRAISTKNFKNEQAKWNYIMAIIENNINDIAIKLEKVAKTDDRVSKVELDYDVPKCHYKPSGSDSKVLDMLDEDIW